jgi:4a-hydroxytetrahydrobiopterin dehydratase
VTEAIAPDALAQTDGLDAWRYAVGALHAEFECGSFAIGAGLVASIAAAADRADHHPEVALRYPGVVRVDLSTHDAGGVTDLDVALAREVSVLAAAVGATARPWATRVIELAIDTADADRIRPFWKAVLGYDETTSGALVDPARVGPPMWFQDTDDIRTERGRFHLDVSVAHDAAGARVAAALAAGGTMVTDRFARSWWVLADADGNEACICTWQDR